MTTIGKRQPAALKLACTMGCSIPQLLIAVFILLSRISPIAAFQRSALVKKNHYSFSILHRSPACWATNPVTQFSEAPPYRLPSNLTDQEIRSLKPDERFRYRIRQLLEYKAEHGHYNVKQKENWGLCSWIVTQRSEYRMYMRVETKRQSLLSKERIEQLTKIGFDWRYQDDGLTPVWMKWFETLERFESDHGHICVSRKEDPKLHKWLCNQRDAYKRWKDGDGKGGMTEARCEKLEALGMLWRLTGSGMSSKDVKWNTRLQELKEFKKEHGHCFAPQAEPLGRWVATQRTKYRDKLEYNVSSLTDEREAQLRELGVFNGAGSLSEIRWENNFQLLKDFYEKNNHTNVPSTADRNLRNWIAAQRRAYLRFVEGKSSPITSEQVARLEELGFAWSRKDKWMENYQKLQEFYNTYNHTAVPSVYPQDPGFGHWVTSQRKNYRKAKKGEKSPLSKEQIELLQEVSIASRLKSKNLSFEDMLDELRKFKEMHGHCLVPQQYRENPRLGQWAYRQKKQYALWREGKPSTLTNEQRNALDEIGFEWLGIWECRLKELQDFRKTHGHFNVPATFAENQDFADWATNIRQKYKQAKKIRRKYRKMEEDDTAPKRTCLAPNRVEALDAIGFEEILQATDSAS